MNIKYLSIFFILTFSCNKNNKALEYLQKDLSESFETENIDIVEGISTNSNLNNHPYIEINIADCKFIDNDTSYNLFEASNGVAIRVYEILSNKILKENYSIDINIDQKINDEIRSYSFSIPVKEIGLATLNGIKKLSDIFEIRG